MYGRKTKKVCEEKNRNQRTCSKVGATAGVTQKKEREASEAIRLERGKKKPRGGGKKKRSKFQPKVRIEEYSERTKKSKGDAAHIHKPNRKESKSVE